jgi:hypothetical protein
MKPGVSPLKPNVLAVSLIKIIYQEDTEVHYIGMEAASCSDIFNDFKVVTVGTSPKERIENNQEIIEQRLSRLPCNYLARL